VKSSKDILPKRVTTTYANARRVLPPDLLASIQQHYSGGLLYIPPAGAAYFTERRWLILELRSRGVKTAEIARMACVSPRRVLQILAQAKKAREGETDSR
jgi:DNA-binding NarL/FixJ family response regulator